MSQENTASSQTRSSAQEDATTTEPSGTSTSDASATQATFELLLRLLDVTKGDLDQAEKLAQLIARLSPASPLSLLTPSAGGHNCHGCGGPSTKTSVGTNSAAAAAASTTGVAVATSVPNSSATASAVAPSLLTVGSTTSTTAVPFSDLSTIPSGINVSIGGVETASSDDVAGGLNIQPTSTSSASQANSTTQQQNQTVLPRVQFQNTPSQSQEQSKPPQPSTINTSTLAKTFPWQTQQYTSDQLQQQQQQQQQPAQHHPDETEANTLNELSDSPIQKARIVNIQKRPSPGSRSPTFESLRQRSASSGMKPSSAANIARQRPMSLNATDTYMNRFLTSEDAQNLFDKFSSSHTPENEVDVPHQQYRQVPSQLQSTQEEYQERPYQTQDQNQNQDQYLQHHPRHSLAPPTINESQSQPQQPPPPSYQQSQPPKLQLQIQLQNQSQNLQDKEDLEAENAELKDEIARLTQQCRAWERIASLSVNLASVEGDSKRASLVSSVGVGFGAGGAGFV